MPNYLVLILRALAVAMLAYLIVLVGLIYDNQVFNFWTIASVLGDLRDFFSYLGYITLYYVFSGIYYLFGALFTFVPYFDPTFYRNFALITFSNIVGRWFYLPGIESTTPAVWEVTQVMLTLGQEMMDDLYIVIIQLFMLALFFYTIRGSIVTNPSDSIKVIIFLNLILIVPMFFIRLNEILWVFQISTPVFLQTILDAQLLKESIYYEVSNDFWAFISSEIFTVALASFIYLEIIFQIAYVDQVTSPSVEREARLRSQIDILKVEAERAVANIKQVEETKRKEQQLKREMEITPQTDEKTKLNLSTFMTESGKGRFSYVSELIEKKRLEREEKMRMDAMKDTRKLANYLDKLFAQDKEAYSTLTAKTSAPSASNLVITTVINLSVRIFVIVLLTWAVVHPQFIFQTLFSSPAAISESVELETPEAVLAIFIPILLIIPLISAIIRATKHAKLNELLRLEAIQRSGMTEEELKAATKKREEITETETTLDEDADVKKAVDKKAAEANKSGQKPSSTTNP